MLSSILSTAILLNGLYSHAAAQTVPSSNCTTGVHMIVARGSTEQPGEGIIGAVARQIEYQVPGSDSVAVVYPATINEYIQSETDGVNAMTKLIEEYVASCPNSKYALLGYSQGAQIIGDVLCGTSEPGWLVTSSLASNYGANFVAAIQMGDPSFVPNQPQDAGTSKVPGIFNRTNPAGCLPYESRIQSYCNTGDFFCAKGIGPNAIEIHLLYVTEYGANASNFVANQFSSLSGVSGAGSSTTSVPSSTTLSSSATTTGATTTGTSSTGTSTTGTASGATTSPTSSGAGATAAPHALGGIIAAGIVAFNIY